MIKINLMDPELSPGLMAEFIKECILMVKEKELDNSNNKMVQLLLLILKMVNRWVKRYTNSIRRRKKYIMIKKENDNGLTEK